MKKFFYISLMAICVCSQTEAFAKDSDQVTVENGFATATRWRALPAQQRMLYVLGVVDGVKFSAVLVDGPEGRVSRFAKCTGQMTGDQLLAIVDKHVDSKPETWHESVHFRVFEALTKACRIFK